MVDKEDIKINKDIAASYLEEAEKKVRLLRLKIMDCDSKDMLDLSRDFIKAINNAEKIADMPVREITYEERKRIHSEVERLEKLYNNMTVTFDLNCACHKR